MTMASTPETLDDILKKLLAAIPEVKAAAIVSVEGLPIASALPAQIDETRIAAMTAAILSLAERAVHEMEKGDFEQILVRGSEGFLLVLAAGPNAVLTVSTTKDVRLGLIFLDCKRTCEKIAKLI
ncbi:MAG: roadblock/LC7 domain-containing protein [Promethearchaeota archaeon]